MIKVEGQPGPRRDLALWSRAEQEGRPEMLKVRDLLSRLITELDRDTPCYGLDL
jgi:hypothetical protein